MNILELGAIGELVGGVAVLVTLIYLAVQIRHAREQLKYQVETDLHTRLYDAWAPVYEGRNAEILWAGLNEPGSLDGADLFVFDLLMRRNTAVLVEAIHDHAVGATSDEWIDVLGAEYRTVLTSKPGGRAWILDNRDDYQNEIERFRLIE